MRHKDNYKYNYFYKITNNLNGNFYYGIHSTNNLEDGYMGSGLKLNRAYKKYGIENFSKEIIKFFDTREELADYEASVVTESLVYDDNCYNISLGGEQLSCRGTFPAFDKTENKWKRITNQEYKEQPENFITSVGCDKVLVRKKDDIDGDILVISKDEYYSNKDLYTTSLAYFIKNYYRVIRKDNKNTILNIRKEEFDENLYIKLDYWSKGKVTVKDKSGRCFSVSVDDPRYLSKELIPAFTGYKFTDEQKEHLKKAIAGKQKGEKNSQYGTKWMNRNGIVKKVKKEDIDKFLSEGWKYGKKVEVS